MRLIAINPTTDASSLPPRAVVSHDVRDTQRRSEVLVRKGSWLEATDIARLLEHTPLELHLAVPEPGDVVEDEAAAQLAAAIAGPGVRCGPARFGQVTFAASSRGMLRVDAARVEQVDLHDGVLLLTSLADRPVDSGTPLGVVKCAPLFLSERVVESVAALGPCIQLQAFEPRRAAFVAPIDRLRGNAFARATASLELALNWYGSTLQAIEAPAASTDLIAAAFQRAVEDGAELILAAGAAATDSADAVFDGLRQAGGEVDQIGIPAEPGTACWIGRLAGRPVLGLASCELFGQPGALDLLLPRLLVGEPLDRALLRRLAVGGLLVGGPSRVAPYHTSTVE